VGGVEWGYVYDPENRLKEVWRGAERVASFRYDPEGNRVVREVGGLRTVVVDEGYEVRGGVVRKVYRLGGETVAVQEGNAVYATVGDHLGSVTVLAQGGSVAGATRYLPYGAIRLETGVWPTDRRFTGQRWEASLGLYDYRARFYDPTLGRFLQPDPLVPEPGNPQALNRYAYVYSNRCATPTPAVMRPALMKGAPCWPLQGIPGHSCAFPHLGPLPSSTGRWFATLKARSPSPSTWPMPSPNGPFVQAASSVEKPSPSPSGRLRSWTLELKITQAPWLPGSGIGTISPFSIPETLSNNLPFLRYPSAKDGQRLALVYIFSISGQTSTTGMWGEHRASLNRS